MIRFLLSSKRCVFHYAIVLSLIMRSLVGVASPLHARDERDPSPNTGNIESPLDVAKANQGSSSILVLPNEVPLPIETAESFVPLSSCPTSEIFEISTRHLPDHFCAIDESNPNLDVTAWNFGRWRASSIQDALSPNDQPIILYVHGNFMERDNARERVRILDCYLKRQAKENYRLIMFSWPSSRERKPLRDAADNAKVAEMECLYLAWILRELRNHERVSIVGFSYGARTVTGALHLDAGGTIPCLQSLKWTGPRSSPYRLGLVAPAVDKSWIIPTGKFGKALTHIDGFVNLYNSRDPVLRRFRFIDRVTKPIAGGLTGFDGIYDPRSITPFVGLENTRQYDCGAIIGTTHSEKSYYGECPYFRTLIDNVLWNPTNHATTCSRCNSK